MNEAVMTDAQRCPICAVCVNLNPHYTRYLCRECAPKAASPDGSRLRFANISISGGFIAHYSDTGERYPSHVCVVEDVECHADEAYFGGIVIQTMTAAKLSNAYDTSQWSVDL